MGESAPESAERGKPTSRSKAADHVGLSIGARLGVSVVVVVGLAMALAFAWFSRREHEHLIAAKRTAAEMVAQLFAASLGAPLDFADEDAVRAELENLRQNPEVEYAAVWISGTPAPFARAGATPADLRAPTPGTNESSDRVVVGREVTGGSNEVVGSAIVAFSLARENATYRANRARVLWLALALALGTMALLVVVTRREVVVPIDHLLRAVRRIERGERGVGVAVKRQDEIGRLARAFQAMDAAIADRERELAEAHGSLRELFDHMRQAILVFDADGRVRATQSRQAARVLGGEDLEGRAVAELLYPGRGTWDSEKRAFDEWLGIAFEATEGEWEEIGGLAPPGVKLGELEKGDERVLSLEFRPIFVDGRADKVILLATDVTLQSRLEREVVVQGERHARQMQAMSRLVSGGGSEFVQFLDGARRRLERCVEALGDRTDLPFDELVECFGHIHTVRGEARAFGLDELAQAAAAIEERLVEARTRATASGSATASLAGAALGPELAGVRALVDQSEKLFVEASPIGKAVLEQVTVRRPDVDELLVLARSAGGPIARVAERLAARNLGEIVAPLAESAGRWALAEQKRARVEVTGRDVLVPERLSRVLGGVLTHLVRNALAHGIENAEGRERAGKGVVGLVAIRAEPGFGPELAPSIVVEDDGRGIGGNPLLRSAALRGVPLEPDHAEGGSFRTAAADTSTELSGRGVGLAAVVRELAAASYSLTVEELKPEGTRLSIRPRMAP